MKNAHQNQDQLSVEMVSALSKVLSRTGQKTVTISITRDVLTTLEGKLKNLLINKIEEPPLMKNSSYGLKTIPEACIC